MKGVEIVNVKPVDPAIQRINNRARNSHPAQTMHNGALLVFALACVVIYGAATLAGWVR